MDKHEQILDKLVEQQIRIEEILKVQIRRADIQEAALKDKDDADRKRDLKLAETLATMGQSMTMIKWVAGLIGGTLILNFAQHFLPK
ncbi:MAG TPA: hypothetical protein VHV10_16520 [Ktedonobacteraceae bacterium]|nr:hypothetical protein [Ktedonobacteraceae bacterium]